MNKKTVTLKEFEALAPLVERRCPQFWSRFCPRRWRAPETHYHPATIALHAMDIVLEAVANPHRRQLAAMAGAGLAIFCDHGAQTYWASEAILESIVQTDPPPIAFTELLWPHESMQFILPRKWSLDHTGVQLSSLCVSRMRAGSTSRLDPLDLENTPCIEWTSGKLDLMILNYSVADRDGRILGCNAEKSPITEDSTIERQLQSEVVDVKADQIGNGSELDFLGGVRKSALHIAIGLMMVMSHCPEYIEERTIAVPGQSIGKGKEKRVIRPTIWGPRWIGRTFVRPAGPPGPGTHASPIMHWRRGHWRRQAVGAGRREHVMRWIKPMLVNAPEVRP